MFLSNLTTKGFDHHTTERGVHMARIRIDARDRVHQWREDLTVDPSTTLIAEVDGHIAGFVVLDACRDDDVSPETVGEVTAIFVRPEEWGLGIGKALMRAAMARLRDGGWVEVALWVLEGDLRAVGFYERLGFRMDGAVRFLNMYGHPASRVRLRRLLEESE